MGLLRQAHAWQAFCLPAHGWDWMGLPSIAAAADTWHWACRHAGVEHAFSWPCGRLPAAPTYHSLTLSVPSATCHAACMHAFLGLQAFLPVLPFLLSLHCWGWNRHCAAACLPAMPPCLLPACFPGCQGWMGGLPCLHACHRIPIPRTSMLSPDCLPCQYKFSGMPPRTHLLPAAFLPF